MSFNDFENSTLLFIMPITSNHHINNTNWHFNRVNKKRPVTAGLFLLDIISCNGVALHHKRWHAIA